MGRLSIKTAVVAVAVAFLGVQGCASFGLGGEAKSVTQSGVNSFRVKPVEIGDQAAKDYRFDLGKECQHCVVDVQFNEDGKIQSIHVDFKGVAAFQGQAQAAQAVVAVQRELKELGIEGAGVLEKIAPAIINTFAPVPIE